ncbi:MAG: hypothetical protein WA956_16220 [Stenotrophomonas sp.]
MNRKKYLIAVAVALACAQMAQAEDGRERFTLSGFGTLGVAHSTEDNADVHPDFQSSKGVGASDSTSARLDSRFALQLNANFTDDFTGVVQAVSEYAVTESYKPEISLAHVKYRFSPSFSARLGRITAPLYMLSEYQRVGYAMPWARPPQEVYNYLLAMDGIEGLYTINAGDTLIGLQGFYGHIDSELVEVDDMYGLGVQVDRGASSFRISHIRGKVHYSSNSIEQLFDFYATLPIPPLVEAAGRLDPRNMDGQFSGIGYSYDPGNWFLRTEVIQADYAPSVSGKTTSGYLSSGFRRGAWTPTFTYAHVDVSDLNAPGALDPVGLLNQAVASNNSSRHSYTASLRWDVRDSIAVKLQGSHVKNHAGSYGSLGNQQPGFQTGRSYNLISASVDFVF